MDLLQLYNHLSLLTLAGSLLAILGLRFVTGSQSHQIELIKEFRTSLERASRNCMRARSVALAREFEAHDHCGFGRGENIVLWTSTRLIGRHYVEESDRLIRTLATITHKSNDMRVSQLRRSLRSLKRVERESVRLIVKLETAHCRSAE